MSNIIVYSKKNNTGVPTTSTPTPAIVCKKDRKKTIM